LAAKKQQLRHGHWLPWLEVHADVLGFGERAARKLIKGAEENRNLGSDLSPEQALHISRQIWDHNAIADAWVNSGNDEWFTLDRELNLARAALGGTITLDPASCAVAQRRVQAKHYFTKQTDGVAQHQHWRGTVFCNPPYSLIAEFTDKLIIEYEAGRTSAAVMLTPASTSTRWFQKACRSSSLLCLSNGRRIQFINANGEEKSPAQGHAFFYFGRDLLRFARVFDDDVGVIVSPSISSGGAP
jgi:hypothetical protein